MDRQIRERHHSFTTEEDEDIVLQGLRQFPSASSRDDLLRPHIYEYSASVIDNEETSAVNTPLTELDDDFASSATVPGTDPDTSSHHIKTTRLVPILPPDGYPKLDWRPTSLQRWLLITMAISSFGTAGATFSLWHGAGSDLQITLTNENVHFLSTYLPAIIATVTMLLFKTTVIDFCRMTPFYAMSDSKDEVRFRAKASDSIAGSFYPWPEFRSTIRPRDLMWMFNILHVSRVPVGFLIGAKVSLLTSERVPFGWTLVVNPSSAMFIIVAYVITGLIYLSILLWVSHHQTGLKWELASIQDHLTLFSETNATSEFESLSTSDERASLLLSKNARWRIGYWRKERSDVTGKRTSCIVYGIASSDGVDEIDESVPSVPREASDPQIPCNCRQYPCCRHGPRRFCIRATWWSRFWQCFYLLFYLSGLGAAVFLIATGKFISGFTLRNTVYYYVIFRSLLVQTAHLTVGHIGFLDISIRASQPYISMSQETSPGSDSIGLEYLTMMAFQIPLVAFAKSHYRVVWFTTVNAISSLCPIMLAGVLITKPQDDFVEYQISKVSFFVILFYCIIFPVTIIWSWTKENERLPRLLYSMADHMSLCCGARILGEPQLNIAIPKMTREKFLAKMTLLDNKYRLGHYMGTCGHEHFGFDVVETSDERMDLHDFTCNLVTPVTRQPKSGSNTASSLSRSRARRQQVPDVDQEEEQGMIMQRRQPHSFR